MFEKERRRMAAAVEEGARGGGGLKKVGQADQPPVHSQVRRIKQEDEEARELLHRLQLLEMRPANTGFLREIVRRQASPSPLRRAGRRQAISVGNR